MSFLTDEEINALAIKRMIFHIVGGELEIPVLLSEISPPEHVDFFLERIKSALSGNMFRFTELSNTERILRLIRNHADTDAGSFTEQSTYLANDFQSHHLPVWGYSFFLSFTPSTMKNCLLSLNMIMKMWCVTCWMQRETSFRSPDSNVSAKASSRKRKPCRKLL